MNAHTPVRGPLCLALLALLAGCSTAPPLMFADNVTFGLQLGNATTAGGGSVSLGYKQYSLAVVPVTVLSADGQAQAAMSTDVTAGSSTERKDALSVFAVFESGAGGTGPLRVGQAFATGLAAHRLTEGYGCKLGNQELCRAVKGPPAAAAAAVPPAPSASAVPPAPPAPAAPPATSTPYQYPLVYSRSDVVGLDIGGSAVEQGVAFTFGFGSRNIALVPVMARSADGGTAGLHATDGDRASGTGKDRDAFSVLGQFASNTELQGLGFCLERYFATGMAAQNLARGLAAAAASKAASAPPAGAASGPCR